MSDKMDFREFDETEEIEGNEEVEEVDGIEEKIEDEDIEVEVVDFDNCFDYEEQEDLGNYVDECRETMKEVRC